ncbi:Uncharacterised protein [Vibrio cholerae]|nr:Uncharacterised protein [Vibrio cholerae]
MNNVWRSVQIRLLASFAKPFNVSKTVFVCSTKDCRTSPLVR